MSAFLKRGCTEVEQSNRKWARVLGILGVFALFDLIVVASIYEVERWRLNREMWRSFVREGKVPDRYVVTYPGIRQPPTRPADNARLADSEEVIGILVGTKARAYRLVAMRNPQEHVINDVVAGVPVTVTYCDLNECIRAFSEPHSNAPLDMSQGGLKNNRMVVVVGGMDYLQDDGQPVDPGATGPAFPYERFPATRTSWKSWRESHPHTDVYTGDASAGQR